MKLYSFLLQRYAQHFVKLTCYFVFLLMVCFIGLILMVVKEFSIVCFQMLLFIAGWFTWTFTEYMLHRFYMHRPHSAGSKLAGSHQHHHSHPHEMVISFYHRILIMVSVGFVLYVSFLLANYFTILAGFITGIAGYVFMHKILHLPLSKNIFRRLSRYHIYHHCKYPHTCFGITVPWWDDLFKTVPKNPRIPGRVIDFYYGSRHHR